MMEAKDKPNKTASNRGPDGRFLPGNNANPNGRPKKDVSLISVLKEDIDKIPAGERQGRTWRQLLVLSWLTKAMKEWVYFKELLDRLDGKVIQPIGGEDGQPIEVKISVLSERGKELTNNILKGKRTDSGDSERRDSEAQSS